MKIPTEFQMLGRTIRVEYSDRRNHDTNGLWCDRSSLITLYTRDAEASFLEHTFWHEFVHAWLEMAGLKKLSEDEEKVDLLGGMLHQALSSMDEPREP